MTDSPADVIRKPIDSARKHVGGLFRQMLAVVGLMHIAVAIPVGMATPFRRAARLPTSAKCFATAT